MSAFVKDPDATLDYGWDWSAWLDGDTIATAEVLAEDGITVDSDSATATTVTVWLSGGTVDEEYRVTSRITTGGGRTDDRTMTIYVQHR